MPYCPRCACEYAVGVETCVDCEIGLVLHRPRGASRIEIDTEDYLVPLGAFVVLIMALGLLGIRYMATSGQIEPPLGPLIASAQPDCFVIFYVIAAALSAFWLIMTVVRLLIRR